MGPGSIDTRYTNLFSALLPRRIERHGGRVRPPGYHFEAVQRPALLVHLPIDHAERDLQSPSGQVVPAPRRPLFRLPQVLRPVLPILSGGAPGGTGVRPAGVGPRQRACRRGGGTGGSGRVEYWDGPPG